MKIFEKILEIFFKDARQHNFEKWRGEDGCATCPNCKTAHRGENALTYVNYKFIGKFIKCNICGKSNLINHNDYMLIKKQNTGEQAWQDWVSDDKKYFRCPCCKSYAVYERGGVGTISASLLKCKKCKHESKRGPLTTRFF